MHGKSIWQGFEVEGRLSDIMTLYIRDGNLPIGWGNYPHVYFTIEYIRKAIIDNKWGQILAVLDETKNMVTIESDQQTFDDIPIFLFNRVHVIYRIKIPANHISKLKKMDTISMDEGWYHCTQITKHNCLITTPDDYKFDTEIK